MSDTARDSGLKKAIDVMKQAKLLARALGVTPQAISQWRQVPPLRVLEVEALTGIPRHDLRPDLYPREQAA